MRTPPRLPLARMTVAALAAAMVLTPAAASAQVTRIQRNAQALILDAAKVSAGSDTLYLSGQLASPVDPTVKMSDVKTLEQMGDTKAQTISVLGKIKAILESQGYTMQDLVKLMVLPRPAQTHDAFQALSLIQQPSASLRKLHASVEALPADQLCFPSQPCRLAFLILTALIDSFQHLKNAMR